MEVTRIFHPVGQGGFYTECFDDLNNHPMVVYDCGGNSSKSMKDYIESFLPDSPKANIEAVFISHLHDDHINGLQSLIKRANVRKIFLPQLTPNKVFDTIIYYASKAYSTDYILSLIRAASIGYLEETSIFQIREHQQINELRAETIDISTFQGKDDIYINSDIIFTVNTEWMYIPFNPLSERPNFEAVEYTIRERIEKIYEETDVFLQAELLARFVKSLSVTKCKEIYKKLFGSIHNGQSMTLFSGIKTPTLDIRVRFRLFDLPYCDYYRHRHHYFYHCWMDDESCVPTNFLYTGDFEANKTIELIDFYNKHKVWDTICGVQMPHHGSRKNYNGCLYNMRCYAIASVGSKNKYHHPNIDTLIHVFQQGCKPYVVTEDKNTIIIQQFKF